MTLDEAIKHKERVADNYHRQLTEWLKDYKQLREQEPIIGKIRAEIEKVFCMSVVTNELRTPMEVKTEILQIIDKYRGQRSGKE